MPFFNYCCVLHEYTANATHTRVVITMGGAWNGSRQMVTYVNGKVCATINKGVFQTPDGRFAISPDFVMLFFSTNESFMPGLRIKYFNFVPYTLTTDVPFCLHLETHHQTVKHTTNSYSSHFVQIHSLRK